MNFETNERKVDRQGIGMRSSENTEIRLSMWALTGDFGKRGRSGRAWSVTPGRYGSKPR